MKKQRLFFILFLILIVFLFPSNTSAAEILDSGSASDVKWTLDSDGVLQVTGEGELTTSFQFLSNKKQIKTVIFSDGITGIASEEAFNGCSSLSSVTFGTGMAYVSRWAFINCSSLSEIHVPSITDWLEIEFQDEWCNHGYDLYCGGQRLTDAALPDEQEALSPYAFSYCKSLEHVTIPYGIRSIGVGAFQGCSGLEMISIADSVETIGANAFAECSGLSSIHLPIRLKELPTDVFDDCTALKTVELPYGLSTVGLRAFYNCSALESILIPDRCTTISNAAFMGCTSLKQIRLPSGLTAINDSTFYGCKSLPEITLPQTVSSIGAYAFYGCTALTRLTIPDQVTIIEQNCFDGCISLETIDLPDNLAQVQYNAFTKCASLTALTLPSQLRSIGRDAFSGCTSLSQVQFLGAAPQTIEAGAFKDVQATVLYSYNSSSWNDTNRLDYGGDLNWQGFDGTDTDHVQIGGTCGENVYWELSEDGTMTISGSGPMKDYDFFEHSLFGAELAPWNDVKDSISSVTVEDGVTAIGSHTFFACPVLVRVQLADSVATIGDQAFEDCPALKEFSFGTALSRIGAWAFSGCSSLQELNIPSSLRTLDTSAFSDCTALQSVEIPEGVTALNGAFSGCSALESISLPSTLAEIGSAEFSGCSALRSMELPESIQAIGYRAFKNCTGLTEIDLPAGVPELERSAFEGCTALKTVTIPGSVTKLGETVFQNCTSLEEIRFEGDLPSFGSKTFNGVTTTVRYPDDNRTWDALQPSKYPTITWQTYSGYTPAKRVTDCTITLSSTELTYTGIAQEPAVTVSANGSPLERGRDYALSYANNVHAGTATVTITGIGAYTGSVSRTFQIAKAQAGLRFAEDAISKTTQSSTFQNELTKATTAVVGYASSNTNVAAIDQTGTVTIRGMGSTIITATVSANTDYYGGFDQYTLTVTAAEESDVPELSDLTYSFGNSRQAYGYSYSYRIPVDRYQVFFSPSRARALYATAGYWGGSCYGMAVTSGMFNMAESGLELSDFGVSAVRSLRTGTWSETWDMGVTELIETAFVSQYAPEVQYTYSNYKNLNALCAEVENVQDGGGPVMIGVFGPQGGHALLGYEIEKISATTSYLHVYDCNYPNTPRYILLTTDSSGSYTGWYYHLNNTYHWGSSYSGCKITYTPYAIYQSVWADGTTALNNAVNTLSIDADDFVILDDTGNQVAAMEAGVFHSDSEDIFLFHSLSIDTDNTAKEQDHLIFLPTDVYQIQATGDSDTALNITMSSAQQSAQVTTVSGTVLLSVLDSRESNQVRVDADTGDSYSVTLNTSLASADTMEEIRITGRGQGDLGLNGGELNLDSDLEGLWINNNRVDLTSSGIRYDLSGCDITLDYIACAYTGSALEPQVTIVGGNGEPLHAGTDYHVVYSSNVQPGTATVGIYGIGSFTGDVYRTFTILSDEPCPGGHEWDSGKLTHFATLTQSGIRRYTCRVCGTGRDEAVTAYDFQMAQEGPHTVTVICTNNTGYDRSAVLCLAAYDPNGKLEVRSWEPVSLPQGGAASASLSLDGTDAETIKAFLLDSSSCAPLRECCDWPAN